jgi:hypothetical protein
MAIKKRVYYIMPIDEETKKFVQKLKPNPNPSGKILPIYKKYKAFDSKEVLTLEIIEAIFNEVVESFYPKLEDYLVVCGKKPKINFVSIEKCTKLTALMTTYEPTGIERETYDLGIIVALKCLNKLSGKEILYSGGYITKKRVIFIILMLLHEIIHLIEYADPYLASTVVEHTIFFYKTGFKVFGLISRLSEIIPPTNFEKKLNFIGYPIRLDDIQSVVKSRLDNVKDGAKLLNDFSHHMTNKRRVFNGYITYDEFNNPATGIRFLETIIT